MDEFAVVEGSRSKRNRRNKKNKWEEKTVDDYYNILQERKEELRNSQFWKKLVESLDSYACTVNFIRCLALGQPTSILANGNAMYQLALLLLLTEYFNVTVKNVSVWDPVLDDVDRQLFAKIGVDVTEHTLNGSSRLLYYMPHAPLSLINAILEQSDLHKQALIIGNHLMSYDTKMPSQSLSEKYPFINAVIRDVEANAGRWSVREIPTSKGDAWFAAVNDLAIHRKILSDVPIP
jgi:hypothetical protein